MEIISHIVHSSEKNNNKLYYFIYSVFTWEMENLNNTFVCNINLKEEKRKKIYQSLKWWSFKEMEIILWENGNCFKPISFFLWNSSEKLIEIYSFPLE